MPKVAQQSAKIDNELLPTRHKVMKIYVIVPFPVLNPPGTPIIDYSPLINHMASKSRLHNYGRDHDC